MEEKIYEIDSEYLKALKKLTLRELEVLEKVGEGKNSKQIANELGISWFTVKKHRENIRNELNLEGYNCLFKWTVNNQI
jgi:DNA-binding NarL/FixJ family response regulator